MNVKVDEARRGWVVVNDECTRERFRSDGGRRGKSRGNRPNDMQDTHVERKNIDEIRSVLPNTLETYFIGEKLFLSRGFLPARPIHSDSRGCAATCQE